MYNRLFFMVFAAALALPNPAKAGVLLLTNPNQFSGNETLLTFVGVQPFDNVTSYGGVGFQYVGQPPGTGLSGAFDPTPRREFGPPEGTILTQSKSGTDSIQMTFPSELNRAAFELRTVPNVGGLLSIDLLAAGATVESFTMPNRNMPDPPDGIEYWFYGFESSVPFDALILRAPGDSRFDLDNLRFELASVPEPGTLTLLGLGALGLMGYRWRQLLPR
jgi:hypothetical protein